jgi:hypothetical protein
VENIFGKGIFHSKIPFFWGKKTNKKGKHLFENDQKLAQFVFNMKGCA